MTLDELIEKLQVAKLTLKLDTRTVVTVRYDGVCEVRARDTVDVCLGWHCKKCNGVRDSNECHCDNWAGGLDEVQLIVIETDQR